MSVSQFIRLGAVFYSVHAIHYFCWTGKDTPEGRKGGWWVEFTDGTGEFYEPDAAPQLDAISFAVDALVNELAAAQRREREAERQVALSWRARHAMLQDFIRTSGIRVRTMNRVRQFTSANPDHPLAVGLHSAPPDFQLWAETVLTITDLPKIPDIGPKSWATLREKLTAYLDSLEVQP